MQFSQVFWNPNFGDYSGFDSVCEYARAGRHACSSIADFLKARAQIEDHYAKQMLALLKNQSHLKFDGTLGKSWEAVTAGLQKACLSHQKLADIFNNQSQLTAHLVKTLKSKTKQKETDVRQCQNECRSLHDKASKHKVEFTKRVEQRRNLEEERQKLLKESAGNAGQNYAKEAQKLDVTYRKNALLAEASKQQCLTVLDQLNGAQTHWEATTKDALQSIHEMERNRIVFLRGLFWVLMNAICHTCVEVDKECDDVRRVIITCEPESDLQEFAIIKKTGSRKPEKVTFENVSTPSANSFPAQKSFKLALSKRLGNAWKSNGSNSYHLASKVEDNAKPRSNSAKLQKKSDQITTGPLRIGIEDNSSNSSDPSPRPSQIRHDQEYDFELTPPSVMHLHKKQAGKISAQRRSPSVDRVLEVNYSSSATLSSDAKVDR